MSSIDKEVFKRFVYWIRERHNIHKKREAGQPKPWTTDPILQNFFFTNPYRENDKTTIWFRENVREPRRNKSSVFLATVIFRWFNFIDTGQILLKAGLLDKWDSKKARKLLHLRAEAGYKIFTGAYVIKVYNGMSKIDGVCKAIDNVALAVSPKSKNKPYGVHIPSLVDIQDGCINGDQPTMQFVWKLLCDFPYLGKFMAYEIVTDLRHTYLLENAPDIDTWCNLGPGGKRGIWHLLGQPASQKIVATPPGWQDIMLELLERTRKALPKHPHLEMREIEHSLCEFDKYERATQTQSSKPFDAYVGKIKRRYPGCM